MRPLFFVIVLCATTLANEQGPGQYVEKSPKARFTITQRWVKPEYIATDTDCTASDCGWEAVLTFADKSKPEATLATEPEWYSWPADYHMSPDERWIIRDQKTGSGENALFLYHVEPNGQSWRLSQHLDDLVWYALLAPLRHTRDDYYHLEVVLASWDLAAGKVHLKARATSNEEDENASFHGCGVTYDFKRHTIVLK